MKRYVKLCPCKKEWPPDSRGSCPECKVRCAEMELREIDDTPSGSETVQTYDAHADEGLIRCAACGEMTRPFPLCEKCNREPILNDGGATNLPAAQDQTTGAQSDTASAAIPASKLLLLTGTQSFECRDGDIFGKEGTLASQIFQGIGTVSRKHVLVTKRDGKWFLSVFAGVQNATQLDGQELRRTVPHPLTGDHLLKMSHACEITLRVSPI